MLRGDYRSSSSSRQRRARGASLWSRVVSARSAVRARVARRAEPSRAEPSQVESINWRESSSLLVSWPSRAPGTWHASRDQRASSSCSRCFAIYPERCWFDSRTGRAIATSSTPILFSSLLPTKLERRASSLSAGFFRSPTTESLIRLQRFDINSNSNL